MQLLVLVDDIHEQKISTIACIKQQLCAKKQTKKKLTNGLIYPLPVKITA